MVRYPMREPCDPGCEQGTLLDMQRGFKVISKSIFH